MYLPLTPIWRFILSSCSDFFSFGFDFDYLDLVTDLVDFDLSMSLPLTILDDGLFNFFFFDLGLFSCLTLSLKDEVKKSDLDIFMSKAFDEDFYSNGFYF